MPRLPSLNGRQIITALQNGGFVIVRQKGSHVRLQHPDGRVVTVPLHPGQDVGRGLLRKILRDADITRDEFIELLQ
ncbi:MAG: type II toxin-antitoxin system HicA family toxin [Anaerolineales bacterium]|nr:type II toxin-antitoxin system HicA family toxin [Anaerolineales bacterium]